MSNVATQMITVDGLVELFNVRHGARFATIIAKTTPELLPGAPNVVKVSKVLVIVHWNYANSVNNQRVRDGLAPDFKPQPRKWGNRLDDSALVFHTNKKTGEGRYYLETKVEKSLETHYFDTATGAEVPADIVKPFLKPRKPDNGIIIRDYPLDTIESLTHEGTTYIVAKVAVIPTGK